jgi:hypothetical protein
MKKAIFETTMRLLVRLKIADELQMYSGGKQFKAYVFKNSYY